MVSNSRYRQLALTLMLYNVTMTDDGATLIYLENS